MTRTSTPATLVEEIARAVTDVPGVAFLKPDLAGRLRSALATPERTSHTAAPPGVRLVRPQHPDGTWHIDIKLVAYSRTRAVDVARAARRAVTTCVASAASENATVRVTVTVTGMI
ncbi:hypothetical protein [Streptomyces longispororuber]|uniref:hypothetical protein n=1 Tax=Streptomyces longispororuber TaxID=68230 RepID=UPI00210BA5DA|nr:hypothetical protein [Streptomyces longispororuber]MCQ4206923.1 hypothetical protein [Streptomyces longispororuber]